MNNGMNDLGQDPSMQANSERQNRKNPRYRVDQASELRAYIDLGCTQEKILTLSSHGAGFVGLKENPKLFIEDIAGLGIGRRLYSQFVWPGQGTPLHSRSRAILSMYKECL